MVMARKNNSTKERNAVVRRLRNAVVHMAWYGMCDMLCVRCVWYLYALGMCGTCMC